VREIGSDLKEGFRLFFRRGGRLLGAGIAFYSMLSVAPIFVLALHIAGLFTREEMARAALLEDMSGWVGPDGAKTIGALVDRARTAEGGVVATALGAVLLVYASTRLFSALERAINVMWGVERASSDGFKGKALAQLRKRGIGILITLTAGVVLCALVGLRMGLELAESYAPRVPHLSGAVETLMSLVITWLLFLAIFRTLPAAKIGWTDAALGAAVTAALFSLGSHAVAAYVGHKGIARKYGEAGAVVMLLLWVQYSAQIFLIGAATTGARARRLRTMVEPKS
jgi:membrane protein